MRPSGGARSRVRSFPMRPTGSPSHATHSLMAQPSFRRAQVAPAAASSTCSPGWNYSGKLEFTTEQLSTAVERAVRMM